MPQQNLHDAIKERLIATHNQLMSKNAVPVITLGIDNENQVIIIVNDSQITNENLLQFLHGVVTSLEANASPLITPGKLFKIN